MDQKQFPEADELIHIALALLFQPLITQLVVSREFKLGIFFYLLFSYQRNGERISVFICWPPIL